MGAWPGPPLCAPRSARRHAYPFADGCVRLLIPRSPSSPRSRPAPASLGKRVSNHLPALRLKTAYPVQGPAEIRQGPWSPPRPRDSDWASAGPSGKPVGPRSPSGTAAGRAGVAAERPRERPETEWGAAAGSRHAENYMYCAKRRERREARWRQTPIRLNDITVAAQPGKNGASSGRISATLKTTNTTLSHVSFNPIFPGFSSKLKHGKLLISASSLTNNNVIRTRKTLGPAP